MSFKGDIEKIKQVFEYVKQESISVEEMGVKNNEVNHGKKPTLVDTNIGYRGSTPLIWAAQHGRHNVCHYLIKEQKANLEVRDDYQATALIYAVLFNKTEVIKVLLQYKANCKVKSIVGSHAAYWSAYKGNLDALKMLVQSDGDVVDLKGFNGETPLIAASRNGLIAVCKFLVEEKNATVNLKDNDGKIALHHAKENTEIIEILKSKGAK